MKLIDRYKGAMVGVHVGDSLGAPYEKKFSAREIVTNIKRRRGLRLFPYFNPWPKDGNEIMLPAGRPTDDSDQTANLADSLIRNQGLNTEDLRVSLYDSVVNGVSLLWKGKATGAGGTTKKALSNNIRTRNKAFTNTIGTNGSLMRSTPMGLWFGPERAESLSTTSWKQKQVKLMSEVTHMHPHSVQASWLYTKVLSRLLSGKVSLDFQPENELEIRILSRLRDESDFPYDPGDWPSRGAAEFSLYTALHALSNTTSFEAGIEATIVVGGDTDTYAAIAGGLLGAKYGYDAIPSAWKRGILGHDVMVKFAEDLYAMRLKK